MKYNNHHTPYSFFTETKQKFVELVHTATEESNLTTEILCTTMFMATVLATGNLSWGEDEEIVGQRPYEMEWANRTEDTHPPLVDFEDLTGWQVETANADAQFVRSREQQLWGKYVAKLTYSASGDDPEIRITPPAPIPIQNGFEVVSCWIYGKERHRPKIVALFKASDGREMRFSMRADWDNWGWFQSYYRLSPDQIDLVADGSTFTGFIIRDSNEPEDRLICFDNLAVFVEDFKPLYFTPRPRRGIPMFPGQGTGTNTGPGKLPFPTRRETILPDNLTDRIHDQRSGGWRWFYLSLRGRGRLPYISARTPYRQLGRHQRGMGGPRRSDSAVRRRRRVYGNRRGFTLPAGIRRASRHDTAGRKGRLPMAAESQRRKPGCDLCISALEQVAGD